MTTTLRGARAAATSAAERALATAGVAAQPLDRLSRVRSAQQLFDVVWRSPGDATMPAELMRAVEHAGGYAVGAYEGDTLLGASVGFLGLAAAGPCILHSHITGVHPQAQGRHIGWALKLHQRAWALDRGIDTVTWTFDPLVRRNAWFNLGKLGARGIEYLVDFYGPMADGLNAGEPSDRLLARWQLTAPEVVDAVAGRPPVVHHPVPVVLAERDGAPVVAEAPPSGPVLLQLPPDIELLRRTAPAVAREWRLTLRATLEPLVRAGHQVVGMTRSGHLVVRT